MMVDNRVYGADLPRLGGCLVGAVPCAGECRVVEFEDFGAFCRGVAAGDVWEHEQVCFSVNVVDDGGGFGFPLCVAGWDDGRQRYVAVYCYEADLPRFMWYE